MAEDLVGTPFGDTSDDPYVGGIAAPGAGGDATVVTIQAPGPLAKNIGITSATIGEQITYTVRVPATQASMASR